MPKTTVLIHLSDKIPKALPSAMAELWRNAEQRYQLGAEAVPLRKLQSSLGSGDTLAFESMAALLAFGGRSGIKRPAWNRGWERVRPMLERGVKLVLVQDDIVLTAKDRVVIAALDAVANAMSEHSAEVGKARIGTGKHPRNWVLPDKAFLKELVVKVEELGVTKACTAMGITKTTYYNWRDAGMLVWSR